MDEHRARDRVCGAGFLVAVLLLVVFAGSSFFQWFPSRGLVSDNFEQLSTFGKIVDYFWHLALP